ncbi:G1/S-specific cyclin-E1 [Harmonia axyridis]|uniref:G1/S-specific cyclin-E1 n=1 Tax=Harmonia axyridis TaxID=115357 RepID=UPI001E277621|nr:G1/S-specific cyclin-E1 [Harmonia axyridis]
MMSDSDCEEPRNECTLSCKDFDSDALNPLEDEMNDYGDTDQVPFNELLQNHHKQTVWGFKFGEEIMRRAKENMMAARSKHGQDRGRNDSVSSETCISEKPSCSKSITEINHKTPLSQKRQKARLRNKRKRMASALMNQNSREAPLPLMNWADAKDVWLFMVYKEEASLNLRNPRLFEDFSNFLPRMRAILLDWIMEVCEVYHLRRVTYYLGVDYFDRFLSIRPDVPKNQLQLVGVTCLFLAAKLEEIYPPRVTEFSYVCDGACSPDDILNCELLILNSLGWDLSLMTPSDWLNLYMQLHFKADELTPQRIHREINKDFLFPQYSGFQFTRASLLIDMMSLDPGFLRFSYSTVAAAAMYFMYGKQAALSVSGLTWDQLKHCAEYMAVFYHVLQNSKDTRLQSCSVHIANDEQSQRSLEILRKSCKTVVPDENHSLQTHAVNMDFFEQSAIIRMEQMGKNPSLIVEDDCPEKIDNGVSFDKMLEDIVISNSVNYPVRQVILHKEDNELEEELEEEETDTDDPED